MKNKILLAVLAFFGLAMVACKSGGGDPKDVAKKFFEAIKTMNIEEASKYATKESKSMLDLMKMGMNFAPQNMDSLKKEMAKQKIEYGEAVINGDEATVSVTVDGKDKTDFKLKKEEGQWKVAFDKSTLMQSGMEKMQEGGATPEEMKEAEDALKMLNSDSLKNALNKAGDALKDAGKAIDSAVKQ